MTPRLPAARCAAIAGHAASAATRGMALMELVRPDEAAASFEHALSLKTGYVEARLGLAKLAAEEGRFAEAEARLRGLVAQPIEADWIGDGSHMLYAEALLLQGKGKVLDQFANPDNPRIHVETTGPEIWADTKGKITHFVSAMGTTGTITGVSQYLKKKNPAIKIIGVQPTEGSRIPGIRKWPEAYLPKIYDPSHIDELLYVSQEDAEEMCRQLAREEGIFAGISAAGACWVAREIAKREKHATIVFIVCDRGDRYLSTGVFPA